MLVHRQIVLTEVRQPIHRVLAAIAARTPRRAADDQVGFPAVEVQVLGDLAAGLAAADHQNLTGGKLAAVAVSRRMQLLDRRRQAFGEAGDVGLLVAANRQDDRVGGIGSIGGLKLEAMLQTGQHGDPDGFFERRLDPLRISLDVADDVIAHHEAVWIVAGIIKPRQFALPVRGHQAEAVPALRAP